MANAILSNANWICGRVVPNDLCRDQFMCMIGLGYESKVSGVSPSKLGMLNHRLLDHRLLQWDVAETCDADTHYRNAWHTTLTCPAPLGVRLWLCWRPLLQQSQLVFTPTADRGCVIITSIVITIIIIMIITSGA